MDTKEELAQNLRQDATETRSILLSQKVQMFPTPEAHPRGVYPKLYKRGNPNLAAVA
jgi:hypothetical protein